MDFHANHALGLRQRVRLVELIEDGRSLTAGGTASA